MGSRNRHLHGICGGEKYNVPNFKGGCRDRPAPTEGILEFYQRMQHQRPPYGIYHPVHPTSSLRHHMTRLVAKGIAFDLNFSVYQNQHDYVLARAQWDFGKRTGWIIMSPDSQRQDSALGYCVHDATAENYPPTGTAWTPITLPSTKCSDEPILHSETDESLDSNCFRLTEGELQL